VSRDVTLEEVPAEHWPALAAGFSDFSYEQDADYVAAGARRVGARVRRLAVLRDGEPIGAACLRIKAVPGLGRGIAYALAGPLTGRGPAKEAEARAALVLEALRSRLVDGEGHLLRVRPPMTAAWPDAAGMARAGFAPTDRAPVLRTVLIDLAPDAEALRKGLHQKWRYELRRAEAEATAIDTGRSRDLVERFLALYAAMREFKSFEQNFDPAFLLDMTGTGFDFEVRIAHGEDGDVAGHVTAFTPVCATYLFGATNEAGRALRAGYALGWDAILGARARGAQWFDLGGVDKETNPAGHTFKIRTGGREVMAGPWEAGTRLGGPLLRGVERAYGALRRRSG
jgi:lipid II:glycine glycyltransferase (peptidoglycan interpeptide bridge formation enzyme)